MHDEIWRDIPGFEGYYMVSNLGRVKSLPRKTNNQYGKTERVLKPGWVKRKDSYKFVDLSKDGIRVKFLVHRLVAAAFVPNPNNLPYINHKDCNPENNRADNLEWCDARYNVNYGDRTQKVADALSIPVKQYTLDGDYITWYPSAVKAGEKTGISSQNISRCRAGSLLSAGGFLWTY